jgi:hypothetical protein
MSRPLYPKKKSHTHWTGGRVGARAKGHYGYCAEEWTSDLFLLGVEHGFLGCSSKAKYINYPGSLMLLLLIIIIIIIIIITTPSERSEAQNTVAPLSVDLSTNCAFRWVKPRVALSLLVTDFAGTQTTIYVDYFLQCPAVII